MKRSPIKRTAMKRGTRRSSYARRERDMAFMGWVKLQPCLLADEGGCEGVVEADHAGERGLGRKAPDDTCIPLCTGHHRHRTDYSGPFRGWTGVQMRAWLNDAIERTRARFERRHARGLVELPF